MIVAPAHRVVRDGACMLLLDGEGGCGLWASELV